VTNRCGSRLTCDIPKASQSVPSLIPVNSQSRTGRIKDRGLAALSLLCVLLVAFTGVIQAIHVHSDSSTVPSHECSICSVAHAGVLSQAVYRPVPVFVRAVLVIPADAVHRSSGFASSLHIRPPPVL
jgi:hypothetical protein